MLLIKSIKLFNYKFGNGHALNFETPLPLPRDVEAPRLVLGDLAFAPPVRVRLKRLVPLPPPQLPRRLPRLKLEVTAAAALPRPPQSTSSDSELFASFC